MIERLGAPLVVHETPKVNSPSLLELEQKTVYSPGMPPKPPRGHLRLALNGESSVGAVAISSFQNVIDGIQFIDESPAPTPTSESPFTPGQDGEDATFAVINSLDDALESPASLEVPTIAISGPEVGNGTGEEVEERKQAGRGGGGGGRRSGGSGGSSSDEEWDRHSVYHQPPKAADRDAAARLAKRLYHLDGFKVTDVAKHLYKRNDFSQLVAENYVSFFDFTGKTLDQALRLFLSKFALVGETQERERILIHFSKRFVQCNPQVYNHDDDCHALVCALMLLNTDLHGMNVQRKMTCEDFVSNIRALQNGEHFSLDDLTTLYNAIKAEPLLSPESMMASAMLARGMSGHHVKKFFTVSGGTNPFLEMPSQDKIEEYKRGYLFRKSVMDSFGRKSGITKRRWRKYFAVLKDLFLFLYKDERAAILAAAAPTEEQRHKYLTSFVRLHHSMAWRIGPSGSSGTSSSNCSSVGGENGDNVSAGSANSEGDIRGSVTPVTRRSHVFQLQTADGGVFLFQVHSHSGILVGLEPTTDVLDSECDRWVERINYVSALLSAPPMSAAVGSQNAFQRHLMPAFRTPCSLRDQLEKHQQRVTGLEQEMGDLIATRERLLNDPKTKLKQRQRDEIDQHESYLRYEIHRFKQYAAILERTLVAASTARPTLGSTLHFPFYHFPPTHNTFFLHHHPHPPHRMARHSLRHIDWTQATAGAAGEALAQRRHTYDVV